MPELVIDYPLVGVLQPDHARNQVLVHHLAYDKEPSRLFHIDGHLVTFLTTMKARTESQVTFLATKEVDPEVINYFKGLEEE